MSLPDAPEISTAADMGDLASPDNNAEQKQTQPQNPNLRSSRTERFIRHPLTRILSAALLLQTIAHSAHAEEDFNTDANNNMAAAAGAAEPPAALELEALDLSQPEAAANALRLMFKTGNFDQIPELIMPSSRPGEPMYDNPLVRAPFRINANGENWYLFPDQGAVNFFQELQTKNIAFNEPTRLLGSGPSMGNPSMSVPASYSSGRVEFGVPRADGAGNKPISFDLPYGQGWIATFRFENTYVVSGDTVPGPWRITQFLVYKS